MSGSQQHAWQGNYESMNKQNSLLYYILLASQEFQNNTGQLLPSQYLVSETI